MLKKSSLIFLITLIIVSCTTTKTKETQGFASVELSFDQVTENSAIIDPQDQVGAYGPVFDEDEIIQNGQNTSKTFGVLIAPSLYKSLDAVDVLKCFEKMDRQVRLISGAGFSAIIAALFAQGDSPEQIKWKIYRELRKEKFTPYSKEWNREWNKFIDKNISSKRLKTSSKSLWLPEYDKEEGRVRYTSKGDFQAILKQGLNINSYDTPLKKNFLSREGLIGLPVDRLVVINSLSDKLQFKSPDGYLLGLYGKIYSTLKNVDNSNILMINIKTDGTLDAANIATTRRELSPICSQLEEVL